MALRGLAKVERPSSSRCSLRVAKAELGMKISPRISSFDGILKVEG